MATKKINGLCASFSKLYKGNVSMIDAITQRTYATENEGDTQVTHTGQVRYSSFIHQNIPYVKYWKSFYSRSNNKIHTGSVIHIYKCVFWFIYQLLYM